MAYAIKATYYYYEGTYGARRDGHMRDADSDRILLACKADAERLAAYLGSNNGPYELAYGEYAAPSYAVVHTAVRSGEIMRDLAEIARHERLEQLSSDLAEEEAAEAAE